MAGTSKTVKIQATFAIQDATGVNSPNKIIKDLDLTISQVASGDPYCVSGSTVDFQVPFGAITNAKRVFLSTDNEVTVKINQQGDTGFPWKGSGILSSESGITGIWITTGPNDTNVSVVIAGD